MITAPKGAKAPCRRPWPPDQWDVTQPPTAARPPAAAGSRFGHSESPAYEPFAVAVAESGDAEFVTRFAREIAERDKRTPLLKIVKTALDQIPIDDLLPALESLLRNVPPPNQHGVRFDQNLSQREMDWFVGLAKIRHDQCNLDHQVTLNRVAVQRFIEDVQRIASEDRWHREELEPPEIVAVA